MMQNSKSLKLSVIMAVLLPYSVQANSINPILPNSSALKWFNASNLPEGAQLAILTGNPQKKEFYVARLKLPANFIIPAHSHLTNEYNTVISGTYYMGLGNNMDKNHSLALPPGSFIKFPAGIMHYGFTKQETIIEISGIGPWGTIPKKLKYQS
jgi:quercetin dioxygenase-like cupin family protein